MKRRNIVVVIGMLLSIKIVNAEHIYISVAAPWRCNSFPHSTESLPFTSNLAPEFADLVWASAWSAEQKIDSDNRCPSNRYPDFSNLNQKYYGIESIVITEVVYKF